MLKCQHEHISLCGVQRSCSANLVDYNAKAFGKPSTLPFYFTDTMFQSLPVVALLLIRNDCFFSNDIILAYCFLPCIYSGMPVFRMLGLKFFSYLALHSISPPSNTHVLCILHIHWWQNRIYTRRRKLWDITRKTALVILYNALRCWHRGRPAGSTSVSFSPELLACFRRLRHWFLILFCSKLVR